MDAPSHVEKKQNIVIFLPLFVIWAAGVWALQNTGCPIAVDAAMTAWYFFLTLIFLELRLTGVGSHAGVWLAALSLLWAVRTGMTDSRPLSAVLTPVLLLLFFLFLKKERPEYPRKIMFPGLALAALACIWEPARFTLSLCFLGGVLRFISQSILKAREEKLRALSEVEILSEMNRVKNQSYADLSHEMKTPLTVISVNAQLASKNLEAGFLDEETVTDIKIISAEATRLTQMVTSLVGLGQLQGTGAGCLLLSLDDLANTTARTFQSLSARYGNTLTVTSDPDLPPVFGNADRLAQVLINLISNANRHTRNGSISISIRSLAERIEVKVTDSGGGIDPGLLPHVFDRYCHGDKGGTGLGLCICKKIIEEHGGEIGIESEVGKGTRVWFTLPAGKDEPSRKTQKRDLTKKTFPQEE